MPFWFGIVDDGSAGRLARRFVSRAVALSIGAQATTEALAHTVEGTLTPLARDEAPKKTGALADGLRVQATAIQDGYSLGLVSDVPYMQYVVHGTGLYATPTPHQAWDVYGLQAFPGANGETVFALHTHHEGQQPDDFPGRALERARPAIDAAAEMAGRRLAAMVWDDGARI